MTAFFRSVFGRVTVVYLGILVLLGVVIANMAIRAQEQHVIEADQRLNADLAVNLAAEFAPFMKGMPDYDMVERTIHNLMVYNPRIEIYVLDQEGNILSYFSDPEKVVRKSVDLAPIRAFLAGRTPLPILGDDPRQEAGRKPFSVAPIDLGDREGLLYVILGGELADTSLSATSENRMGALLIRGLILVLAVSGLVGVSLFFWHTRRFRALNRAVTAFAAGDRAVRLDLKGHDEIADLAANFNEMADTIEASLEKLRETDRSRREQVANISHDLKTPLSSILGYVETIQLQADRLSLKDRDRYLAVIRDNATTLNRLISELSELSKLETQGVQPAVEEFSIAELVHDVALSFDPIAGEKNITLKTDFPRDIPAARADLGLIERVLSNLIRNAIQYTDPGGSIEVKLTRVDHAIRVCVSDTGCGISAEEIPLVKERFYRVDKSRSSGFAGMGLGLSISEMILNLHGSSLEIESEPEKGSSLSFMLPGAA